MADAPRWVNLLSAWANFFAGVSLVISFSVYFIALQVGHCDPRTCNSASVANNAIVFNGMGPPGGPAGEGNGVYMLAKWTMFTEGFLWCLGGALLSYRNICGNNATGAVSQCIISFGGFFFTCSAFGSPANIISLRYLIPVSDIDASGSTFNWVTFSDACPYYGITTFMIATSMGLWGVKGLPKDKIVSPFYGVLCFFLGAWIIGAITLWLPMLAGGETAYGDLVPPPCLDFTVDPPVALEAKCVLDMPTFSWYQLKIFDVIGALFLLIGAVIFGMMDSFLGCPAKDDGLLANAEAGVSGSTEMGSSFHEEAK